MHWALLCAYSPYQNGTVDFYASAEFWTIYGCASMKADDAIKSGEADGSYNCISWSGGRTDLGSSFAPTDPTCPWFDSRGEKQCYDNFYGNKDSLGNSCPRFDSAMTYVPTSNEYESVVDLYKGYWAYTHAAVKKPADDFLHGYDWESKLGWTERIFHVRRVPQCFYGYGNDTTYYKYSGTKAMSAGVIGNKLAEKLTLNIGEMGKIDNLTGKIDDKTKSEFDFLYTEWKKTWSLPELKIQSVPDMFFHSEEFSKFAAFCLLKGKTIIPLCMKKYLEGDALAAYVIYEFNIIPDTDKIMGMVRMNSEHGKITNDGYFTLDRTENGWIRYFKILLNQEL